MKNNINTIAIKSGVLPNEQQLLLLKACLLTGERAIQAFEEWFTLVNIESSSLLKKNIESKLVPIYDTLDLGSQRLLPLLYKNLSEHRYKNTFITQLKSYYKYTWYKNQILLSSFSSISEALISKGIEPILLKGITISKKYYSDFGARPTFDLDVKVDSELWDRTITVLYSEGWSSKFNLDPYLLPTSLNHAFSFHKDGIELDLHHDFSYFPLENSVRRFIDKNAILEKPNQKYLNPASELFLTVLHGYKWNFIPPIRWIADCVLIVKKFDNSDWNNFEHLITLQNTKSPFYDAFDFLEKEGLIEIPENIKNTLNHLTYNKFSNDLVKNQIKVQKTYDTSKLMLLKSRYLKNITPLGITKRFFNHYKYIWNKKNTAHLLIYAFGIFWFKLFKRLGS